MSYATIRGGLRIALLERLILSTGSKQLIAFPEAGWLTERSFGWRVTPLSNCGRNTARFLLGAKPKPRLESWVLVTFCVTSIFSAKMKKFKKCAASLSNCRERFQPENYLPSLSTPVVQLAVNRLSTTKTGRPRSGPTSTNSNMHAIACDFLNAPTVRV